MKKENIKKVVLAYSGGLDTSIIIPWLKENYNNCEVVAVSGDVGQGTELDGLEEKAKATGASKLYVLDLKKDFVENYIFPTLKFGAKYEDYLLGTSFARPCIAKALADIAIKEGADAICHGCTGKGKLKLYKGNIINAGVESPYSLYSEQIATFGESDYDQTDANGFINLFGLPIKVQALADAGKLS